MMTRKLPPALVLIVVVLFVFQGCRGRAAHPVKVKLPGYAEVTCASLKGEAKQLREKIKAMMPIIKKKDSNRILLMATGALLIIPWFFLDLTDPEKIETNALRERYNNLSDLARKRKCRFKIPRLKKFDFDHIGYKKGGRL